MIEEQKAVWNIDDEILKIVKDLKIAFLLCMRQWNLEDAYWNLDLIYMEISAKFKEEEKKEVEGLFINLEKVRVIYLNDKKSKKGDFYINLRNLYKKINTLAKEHGLWFREEYDDEGL